MPSYKTSSLRICIAEDEPASRKILAAMLRKMGHLVTCTADGAELVAVCGKEDFDLVLLDLDMPIMDGLAAAEEITSKKKVPVILVSGHPDLHHVVSDNEPIAVCLSKPVSVGDLEKAISTLCP